MIQAAQLRMARAAMGWNIRQLAKMADCNPGTISNVERGRSAMAVTMEKIAHCFLAEGITFSNDANGFGVRIDTRA